MKLFQINNQKSKNGQSQITMNSIQEYILRLEQSVDEENLSPQNNLDFKSYSMISLLPIFILIGTVGNIINIIIFSRKTMRRNSTFRLMLYLSVFDLLILGICCTDAYLRFAHQIEIRLHSEITCRLHTFLTYLLTYVVK